MKISINWLKDYLAFSLSPDALAHKLTMAGLEVEKIEKVGDDTVLELEITPNRPDCLNALGLAREVSAILNKNIKLPQIRKINFPKNVCSVEISDKNACRQYLGTLVEKVKIAPSSQKIQHRLNSLGLRPINNVVDITNFVLMETGQPLHAFDFDKLVGGKIIVRRAKKGEKILTLDGIERTLDETILVIADSVKPVAIAGVIGGKDTEVTSSTKNILLESASFDPIVVRRAARKLGISTDSSYRFERGVDASSLENNTRRALSLILDESGGILTAHTNTKGRVSKSAKKSIALSIPYLNNRMGSNLPLVKCATILKRLDFDVKTASGGVLKVTAPAFRNDISSDVDLIEEVTRIVGFDNLPMTLPLIKATDLRNSVEREKRKVIRQRLLAQGLNEAVTYAMIDQKSLDRSNLGFLKGVKIQNPLSSEQEMMRPTTLPNLLQAVRTNLFRGERDVKLFELGKIYPWGGEKDVLTIIVTGPRVNDWRTNSRVGVDFYDVKGFCEEALRPLVGDKLEFRSSAQPYYNEGQSASVHVDNVLLGNIGAVSDDVLSQWDVKHTAVYFAQIELEAIYAVPVFVKKFVGLPGFPSVSRDVSWLVKDGVSVEQIKKIVVERARQKNTPLVDVRFVEEYRGANLPAEHRAVIFSFTYQSLERTLRDDEVSAFHEDICQIATSTVGATRR